MIKHGKPMAGTRCPIVAIGVEGVTKHASSIKQAKNSQMHGEIARLGDGSVDLAAEIKKHSDALWIKVKAIEADKENDNGDYFSRDEILKAYKTFEGVPVFTNHENSKVENAKGKVVLAEWDEDTGSVFCTMFVDRDANPSLCRAIEEGYVTDVSMGTQVDYSICSVCKQKAYTADNYCDHVKTMKGRNIGGRKVYEENYGLKFIELSVVTDGACEDCTIREVIEPGDYLKQATDGLDRLRAAASKLKDVKQGGLYKDGGQQEIEMLNSAMDNIEKVLRAMLDQRQFIDLEFMQDLTEVFADLQHVTDELVDQGYGRTGSPAGSGGAVGVPPLPQGQPEGQTEGQPPAVETSPAGGIGTVTRPAENSRHRKIWASIQRIQNRLKDLQEKSLKIPREIIETSCPGGDKVSKEQNRQETINKLASIWENPSVKEFTTQAMEGDLKIVIGSEEIVGLKGAKKLTSIKIADLDKDIQEMIKTDPKVMAGELLDTFKDKYAKLERQAEKAPVDNAKQISETIEAQLDNQRLPEHPRQNEVRDSITEKQLQTEWKGYEQHKQGLEKPRHEITEKQLRNDYVGFDHHVPQDKPRLEVQEGQLRDTGIKGNTTPAGKDGEWSAGVSDQAKQITEGQLEDWKSGGEKPKHEITEKQLREQGDPLGRRMASVTRENAKKVLANALKAMGRTGAHFDCDARTLVATAMEFQGDPRSGMAAISTMEALCDANNMKLMRTAAKNGDAGVKDYLLGELVDNDLSPDVALQALKVLASDKHLDKISVEIEMAKVPPEKQIPAEDLLAQAMMEEPKKEAKVEEVKVVMEADEIGVRADDKEAFANAAFDKATKLASEQGITVTERVHVKSLGKGKVEAALKGIQKEAKTCDECGEGEDDCDCEKETSSKKEAKLAERSESRKKTVKAQFGGGGGGMPTPGMEAGGQAGGGTTMPTPAPDMGMMEEPVGALGGGPGDASADSADDNPESKPPGSICPSCGSEDVGVESGEFGCNNCGAKGTIEVSLQVHNWPDTIQEKGPTGDNETDEGIGDMEGGPGMEMPDVGIAASFKITPEMVKIANQKPVGSWCPHCGSNKIAKQAKKTHACEKCNGIFRVDTYVDQEDQTLIGRIAWYDQNVRKLASEKKRKIAVARVNAKKKMAAVSQKKEKLTLALKLKGLTTKFAKSDLKGQATIISLLHDEGLI